MHAALQLIICSHRQCSAHKIATRWASRGNMAPCCLSTTQCQVPRLGDVHVLASHQSWTLTAESGIVCVCTHHINFCRFWTRGLTHVVQTMFDDPILARHAGHNRQYQDPASVFSSEGWKRLDARCGGQIGEHRAPDRPRTIAFRLGGDAVQTSGFGIQSSSVCYSYHLQQHGSQHDLVLCMAKLPCHCSNRQWRYIRIPWQARE